MAEDIGIELHDKIKAAFDVRCGKDSTLTHIKHKIENGTATMEDTSIYARRMGELLRKSIESTTKPDDLPDGKMYYNIAQSILEPLLRGNYDDINAICAEVQSALDAKKGIGLKPQKADFPAERIRAAIGGAAVKETAEHAIQVLGRTAENITGSFQTDYIKKNAEFRGKAGLTCYIERKDGFRCCDWCAGLAGRYRYPDEVPKDVYRRHDNCTCDVSYVSEKGRQNVHTHQWNWGKEKTQEYLRQLDAEKKAKRAEYKVNGKNLQKVRFKPSESAARRERIERAESLPKPMKLTRAEAKAKESEILAQRRLTYDAKRGIIYHRKGKTHRQVSEEGRQIIDKPTYNKIVNPAIKKGADIRLADEVWTKHLEKEKARAVTIGDVIYFRPDATVSDVLEEVHHFYQNRSGLNAQYGVAQRTVMNEIDAKKYLLTMTEKYNIPHDEVYETEYWLKEYINQMEEMKKRGEWSE
jgi:hypothetical protein